jgi:hypothetical protein
MSCGQPTTAASATRTILTLGDAFSGLLLAAHLHRRAWAPSLALANRFAAALCGHAGAVAAGPVGGDGVHRRTGLQAHLLQDGLHIGLEGALQQLGGGQRVVGLLGGVQPRAGVLHADAPAGAARHAAGAGAAERGAAHARAVSSSDEAAPAAGPTPFERLGGEAGVRAIVDRDGVLALFTRGLRTRLLANGVQGFVFTVLFRYFEGERCHSHHKQH